MRLASGVWRAVANAACHEQTSNGRNAALLEGPFGLIDGNGALSTAIAGAVGTGQAIAILIKVPGHHWLRRPPAATSRAAPLQTRRLDTILAKAEHKRNKRGET